VRPSFDEVFAAEFRPLYRYLGRRVGADGAEDLAAATFATAYANWDRFDPVRPVRPWLYGIAANLCAVAGLSRRPRLVLVVALPGLVVVPAALTFGGRIVDLFEGTPAPPPVSTVFTGNNRFAEMAMRAGFATRFPHVDVSKAHGVIQIQTADGPEDLWAAPNDLGASSTAA
jgi:Sigma-70 region 2